MSNTKPVNQQFPLVFVPSVFQFHFLYMPEDLVFYPPNIYLLLIPAYYIQHIHFQASHLDKQQCISKFLFQFLIFKKLWISNHCEKQVWSPSHWLVFIKASKCFYSKHWCTLTLGFAVQIQSIYLLLLPAIVSFNRSFMPIIYRMCCAWSCSML